MHSIRNVFPVICSFENLYSAYQKARRGKRYRIYALAFERRLEENLLQLSSDLQERIYKPGKYHCFEITEPKRRIICAASFRDRVVHHALVDVLDPLIDRSFIEDTYACRVGKGTHKAIARCQQFAGRFPWVLQCDIRKYFPSIDHQILYQKIERKVEDEGVLWLIKVILSGGPESERVIHYFPGDDLLSPLGHSRGIPIGNLTSQFFANFYLNGFDHFVKENLLIKGYVRYMDDFLLFGDSLSELQTVKNAVADYFLSLRLQMHPLKQQIFPTNNGIRFCGFQIFRFYKRIPRSNLIRFKNRMHRSIHELSHSQIDLAKLGERIRGWIAHAENADSYTLRKHLFRHIRVRSVNRSSVTKKRVIP